MYSVYIIDCTLIILIIFWLNFRRDFIASTFCGFANEIEEQQFSRENEIEEQHCS